MFDIVRKGDFFDNWSPLNLFKKFDDVFKSSSGLYFSEDEDYNIVECDLPGVEKKQIKVTLNEENGYIVVEADNENERNKRKYRYTFSIDSEDIDNSVDPQLSLDNGVLTIKFKKSAAKKYKDTKEKILKLE